MTSPGFDVRSFYAQMERQYPPLDVVLIHLDSFFRLDYDYFNMGLLYIATVLKEDGFKVKCLGHQHLFRMTYNELRCTFSVSKPVLACFYTTSDNIHQVEHFAAQVKRWHPQVVIAVGGPYATSVESQIFRCQDIDVCVVREGEKPVKLLARLLRDGRGDWGAIPGIWYRKGDKIVCNEPEPPIKDLDSLPFPDQSLVYLPGQKGFQIVSGRGCPYRCLFCFQGVHGLKYRQRSARNVVDEIISNIERYGFLNFEIIDDTFLSKPSRVREIAARLKEYREKSGKSFVFFCQGRVDAISTHPDMVVMLKEAGLAKFQVGLEAGHPEILKIYDKKIEHHQSRAVARLVREVGELGLFGHFILGGPRETEETFKATLDLAKELMDIAPGSVEVGAGFMGPYPGTAIAARPSEYGLKVVDGDFKKGLSLVDVHMVTESMGVPEIRRLRKRFYEEIRQHMLHQLKFAPRSMLETHFRWAWRYAMGSTWYNLMTEIEALKSYFKWLFSPRYLSWPQLKQEYLGRGKEWTELLSWYPQRVIEHRGYSDDGSYIQLPFTVDSYRLDDPDEILIYELSSGKLPLGAVVKEFERERGLERGRGELLEKVIFPLFDRLDSQYQIVFYR